ncbi:hypothetical protein BZL30_3786 [Mycobacterium kansasii]|uniref:Uncharacterized protein n=1 Tax=Mycobacterium kansasii TaxID=1768 RepID=A0A1V3X981_MYCKA|nr:hypothetical protein BZL30_3786 [Mycobacterium kansasii]
MYVDGTAASVQPMATGRHPRVAHPTSDSRRGSWMRLWCSYLAVFKQTK